MRRQQSNAIALTLVYCRAFEKETLEDDLHNSLRSVMARSRAVHCIAFLVNSAAIGKKRRLVPHPDPHNHRLARVMQVIPSLWVGGVVRMRLQHQLVNGLEFE